MQPRKRKALPACVYCRRSHMTCDDQRPCTRCVKRNISHLCHDEPSRRTGTDATPEAKNESEPSTFEEPFGEFDGLDEFITLLNDEPHPSRQQAPSTKREETADLDVSATEKFMLTAADPADASAAGRLQQVINAKLKAGLLRPYNYAQGYDRLRKYIDNYMNESSRQRILQPLSMMRPAFRSVAKSLLDEDMVQVEETFERLLLEYDRIFSSVAMPACLWRRTGEIYRGNREFAELVECRVEDLRDGKLAIYELMSEEAAVNYWEKFGATAFNPDQKAVVTTCNLRTREGRKRRQCCFSFTIRRDRYNIPSCIVGNFIPIQKPPAR